MVPTAVPLGEPNMATRKARTPDTPGRLRIGYALSSEEHPPLDLVRHAAEAEKHGFDFALISDHFHPWVDRQGNSPFVWSVLGAIAGATEHLQVGTGVTCPTTRIHPAIIAQAAATVAAMMPGRFFLGVGSGENLNEHVLGQRWPEWDVRAEMLDEAIDVIRLLWAGAEASHHGRYYTVENARLYTLPETPPPIYIAGSGQRMAATAGLVGYVSLGPGPDAEVVGAYADAGGNGPRIGQVTLSWARSRAAARRVAHSWWPTVAIHGDATQELPRPANFEGLAGGVTEDQVADAMPCGPEPEPILDNIRAYQAAGYDHIYLHQVGPDQLGFLEFAAKELLPELRASAAV
jgi:coenzyme F420-dependent glucose-6-phosphate dehydrogenase